MEEMQFQRWTALAQELLSQAGDFVRSLLGALLVLFFGLLVKRLVRAGLSRVLGLRVPRLMRGAPDKPAEAARRHRTFESLVLHTYDAIAWFVIAVGALGTLGVNVASLLTVAGVGGIAVGLGAQTLVKDVLAGVLILLEEQYAVGDTVSLAGLTGEVERMTLRVTELRSFAGDLHVIPNSEIRTVSNHTRSYHRAVVDLSVDHRVALERATRVLQETIDACCPDMPGLIDKPEILGVTDLTADGVTIRVCAKCRAGEHWAVERQLRRRFKDACDAQGIALSIPQSRVHMAKDAE